MKAPIKSKSMELIETLHKGNMLSHPLIKRHVHYAMSTGDFNPLERYIESYPVILALAKKNFNLAEYHLLQNPFPFPDRDDAQEYLSGPIKFGYINQFDDMFGLHPDLQVPK